MDNIKGDIVQLEKKIDKLRVDYEQYFMRITKREPIILREEVDRLVRKLSGTVINNTGDKFKLNTILAKYNTLKTQWGKILRQIEEGVWLDKRENVMGGGQRAVMNTPSMKPASAPASGGSDGDKAVFDAYVNARKQCGESTSGLSYDTFKKSMDAQREKVKSAGAKDVEFKVTVQDGKSKITFVKK